jgi:hypothetical protein
LSSARRGYLARGVGWKGARTRQRQEGAAHRQRAVFRRETGHAVVGKALRWVIHEGEWMRSVLQERMEDGTTSVIFSSRRGSDGGAAALRWMEGGTNGSASCSKGYCSSWTCLRGRTNDGGGRRRWSRKGENRGGGRTRGKVLLNACGKGSQEGPGQVIGARSSAAPPRQPMDGWICRCCNTHFLQE